MLSLAIDELSAQSIGFLPVSIVKPARSGKTAPAVPDPSDATSTGTAGTSVMQGKSRGRSIDRTVSTELRTVFEQLEVGDNDAFEALYRQHRDGLRRFFTRNCGSPAQAQEMAQEVWYKVIRAVHGNSFHAYGSFTSYLYRIARNQLIDWYRRKGISPEVELDDLEVRSDAVDFERGSVPNPEQICADREKARALMSAIAVLPEIQRATLLMYLEGGMSYKEIAEAMGTNRETVKSRLRYARRILRRRVLGT